MGENATVVKADKDHCCAIWRNVLIFVWRGATRPEIVDEHRRYVENHIAKGRGPLSLFVITEPQSEIPDATTREKLAALMQAAAPVGRGAALIYEGTGFRGAAVRGIATALNMLARQPYPYKSFGTVDEAANWLATVHVDAKSAPVRAADLISVVPALRSTVSNPSAA